MDNMSKPVVKIGEDITNIEIGTKRYKIIKTLLIITVICFAVASIIDLIVRTLGD